MRVLAAGKSLAASTCQVPGNPLHFNPEFSGWSVAHLLSDMRFALFASEIFADERRSFAEGLPGIRRDAAGASFICSALVPECIGKEM